MPPRWRAKPYLSFAPPATPRDAAVNSGNSGGPLLDSAGRAVGVNTVIISPSGSNAGIGLAIPVDIVNRIVPQLIRDGRVPTPGIGIVAVSEAAATRLGVEGIPVVRTQPGSSAARAGVGGVDLSTGLQVHRIEPPRTLVWRQTIKSISIGRRAKAGASVQGPQAHVRLRHYILVSACG